MDNKLDLERELKLIRREREIINQLKETKDNNECDSPYGGHCESQDEYFGRR